MVSLTTKTNLTTDVRDWDHQEDTPILRSTRESRRPVGMAFDAFGVEEDSGSCVSFALERGVFA